MVYDMHKKESPSRFIRSDMPNCQAQRKKLETLALYHSGKRWTTTKDVNNLFSINVRLTFDSFLSFHTCFYFPNGSQFSHAKSLVVIASSLILTVQTRSIHRFRAYTNNSNSFATVGQVYNPETLTVELVLIVLSRSTIKLGPSPVSTALEDFVIFAL